MAVPKASITPAVASETARPRKRSIRYDSRVPRSQARKWNAMDRKSRRGWRA